MSGPWWTSVVACPIPGCGGTLAQPSRGDDGAHLLDCQRCGALYPVLAGVPILVPDPAGYLAAYRDPVLATLAEIGAADAATVAQAMAFADAAPPTSPQSFSDDWVTSERRRSRPPEPVTADPHPGREGFLRFLASAQGETADAALVGLAKKKRLGTVVEVACGARPAVAAIADRASRILLTDVSLRAALFAQQTLQEDGIEAVQGVVMDAEAPALRAQKCSAIVSANLVDLLDEPRAFLDGARDALTDSGVLLLATPDPGLGLPDAGPEVLEELLISARFRIGATRDGVPWVRPHSGRHFEVYFNYLVAAHPEG